MKKPTLKSLAVLVLALLAFSAAAYIGISHASEPTSNYTPATGLVSSTTLTIAGSSTVYPVAVEEAAAFPAYWNQLVANNPGWGASGCTTPINVAGAGSGTAIPALTSGTADIGEMSRPPKTGTANGEWQTTATSGLSSTADLQIWAVGVDSVGICVPTIMASWFPSTLTTQEVAELFMDVPTGVTAAATAATDGGLQAAQKSDYYVTSPYSESSQAPAYFTTWWQFLVYYYGSVSAIPSGVVSAAAAAGVTATSGALIQRAVRDPTSGTFDCFDNYFIIPNGFEAEYKVSGNQVTDPITGLESQDMASYTFDETNQNVQTTMENGGLWIGFISAGILAGDSKLTGINIQFNTVGTPNTYNSPNNPVWAAAVAPTVANIKYAFSGLQGQGATGKYQAWRWLWEVTPGQIPASGPLLETGVWIAYMRAINPTTLPGGSTAATTSGTFMGDNQYIYLNPADCTGAADLTSSLTTYNTAAGLQPGQTQTIPDGVVNGADFFYFVDAYINYYANGIYNPYADITAQGTINGASFFAFVSNYISYYTSYNPVA